MKNLLLFAAVALLSVPALSTDAHAQSAPLSFEYDKKIEAAKSMGPLGTGMFGESISTANGVTSFSVTDIDVPGNSRLPVQLRRRLAIEERYLPEELGGIGNWDIDVPYIEGTFSQSLGWSVGPHNSSTRYARCTRPGEPYVEGAKFTANEVWHGYTVHVPGVGSEQLLKDTTGYPDPTDGRSYPWVLKSMGRISCLPTVRNGYPGEGFVLHQTDGTRITFDQAVERTVRPLQKGPREALGYTMPRKRVFLLATRMEDRFGNTVTYTYNSTGRLTSIAGAARPGSAPDNRLITIEYPSSTQIIARTEGQAWTYGLVNGHLASVTRPDGSRWQYSPFGSLQAYTRPPPQEEMIPLDFFDPGFQCNSEPMLRLGATTFTVTHPSGALGTFAFQGRRVYRSNVQYRCVIDFFDHRALTGSGITSSISMSINWAGVAADMANNENLSFSQAVANNYTGFTVEEPPLGQYTEVGGHARIEISNFFDVYSLASMQVTGPGLPAATTGYAYESDVYPYCGIFDTFTGQPIGPACNADPCASGLCTDGVGSWTTVTLPSGNKQRFRHGVMQGVNEGVLLGEETRSASNAILRRVDYRYVSDQEVAGQAFAAEAGLRLTFDPMTSRIRPLVQREINQDGVKFTRLVDTCGSRYCFDAFARPTQVRRFSSLQGSLTEKTTYHDNLSRWVLGQVATVTSGVDVLSKAEYDTTTAMPVRIYGPGRTDGTADPRLMQTITYNADGTPASTKDGNNRITTVGNWYRGTPRNIGHPDGTGLAATLDARGQLLSVTDENGFTTSYQYDAGGRVSRVTFPTGDPVAWAPMTISYSQVASTEHGIAAGHWRQTVVHGNYRKYVYFDAKWQPIVEFEHDTAQAGTSRYKRFAYDGEGRLTFASYPGASSALSVGVDTEYDALGRVSSVTEDSESGLLVTRHQYLAGFKHRTINPRGHATTTSFLVYDEPDTSRPTLIQEPEGSTTKIHRGALGEPRQVQRYGTWAGQTLSMSRHYVYDGHQRVCKAVVAEEGATHFEYDAANNVIRTADGDHTFTGNACDPQNIALSQKVRRTYDARNRLATITYPDGTSNATYTYFPDGALRSLVDGDTTWTYEYDRRRNLTREHLTASAGVYEYRWTYDVLGHTASRQSITGNSDLVVPFAPNALGQPTRAGNFATGATYHPNGSLKSFTYGNGIQRSVTLNARQFPVRVVDQLAGVARYDDTYTYDQNGNPSSITDGLNLPGGSRTMGYDARDRLVQASIASSGLANWTYDPLDNIRSHTVVPTSGAPAAHVYGYDVSNRLVGVTLNGSAWANYVYDARGNVVNKTGMALTFDRANRMTRIQGVANYEYDGHGRRTSQWRADGTVRVSFYTLGGRLQGEADNRAVGSTDYIYLGNTLVAKRFQHWSGSAPVVNYLHADGLGSPVLVTDASGAVVSRERHLSYGGTVDGTVSDTIGYTGHQQDPSSGLVYMQQRYYDPAIGRFLSGDPVKTELNTGAMFNRYNYAYNNPYRYTDPTGEVGLDVVVDAGFTIYDAGRFLGAAAAWTHGQIAGDEFLIAEGLQGMQSTGTDLAISAGSMAVPGLSAPMVRGGANAVESGVDAVKAAPTTQTTVLGENMRDRVIPYAQATGSRTLPWATSPAEWAQMTAQQRYRLNDGQLRARIREGDDFAYIGTDPGRTPAQRAVFDLTRSELLRLNERAVPFRVVPPKEVVSTIGRP